MSQSNAAPIHNYCDRWCERCFLTSRCPIYDRSLGVHDQDNESFWKSIGEQLEQAMQLILTEASKHGLDLNDLSDDDTRQHTRKQNEEHAVAKLTLLYTKAVFRWRQQHLNDNTLITEDQKLSSLKNCLEVIGWYEVFIHAKVMRALSGKYSEDQWPDDSEPKDHDGSAKIALIAIERSLKAWSTLLKLMPDHTLEIIRFMAMLEQAQMLIEQEFPEAWKFIRPGFDEG